MALTKKHTLKQGTPLWLATRQKPLLQATAMVPKTDVVIIGTGVSGALMGDALLQAGYTVTAVDRRAIMSGSTPASTALLQSELDKPLTELQRRLGKSTAARVWWRSAEAVKGLEARIEDLGIACEYRRRTTLYLPGNILDSEGLEAECAARAAIGLRSQYIGAKELARIYGFHKRGAIVSAGNAEADPAKLVSGLWRSFLRRGGRLVQNNEIVRMDESRSAVRLMTAKGQRIHAKYAVFCTGYEVLKGIQPRGYKVISTWVLATKQQSRKLWPTRSLIWEAADPYLYLRTTADGRIIAGGEDESFADEEKRNALTARKIKTIAAKARKLWPTADFTPEFQWSGCFGESPTSLPAIGLVPGMTRCYAVLGFGGNGITFSMLAAQLVSRHIQGLKDPDAELFALS
ncbi:NAD(P)/FAD-dependent oxidoreductase [Aestuariivirga sp.]|uniref:NAD(P)/FAD-dependent oxidoreductase n=1 Tax=Aestuariivirga sp. TaxID=2650926 RepID=UPI0039E650B9